MNWWGNQDLVTENTREIGSRWRVVKQSIGKRSEARSRNLDWAHSRVGCTDRTRNRQGQKGRKRGGEGKRNAPKPMHLCFILLVILPRTVVSDPSLFTNYVARVSYSGVTDLLSQLRGGISKCSTRSCSKLEG